MMVCSDCQLTPKQVVPVLTSELNNSQQLFQHGTRTSLFCWKHCIPITYSSLLFSLNLTQDSTNSKIWDVCVKSEMSCIGRYGQDWKPYEQTDQLVKYLLLLQFPMKYLLACQIIQRCRYLWEIGNKTPVVICKTKKAFDPFLLVGTDDSRTASRYWFPISTPLMLTVRPKHSTLEQNSSHF